MPWITRSVGFALVVAAPFGSLADVGVFAVVKPDANERIGTAFLVDRQSGLLITCYHVVTVPNVAEIVGREWRIEVVLAGSTRYLRAHCVSVGVDGVNAKASTKTDIAVLQLEPVGREVMNLFEVAQLSPQNKYFLENESRRLTRFSMVGFPNKGRKSARDLALSQQEADPQSGLWRFSQGVIGGFSGSPILFGRTVVAMVCEKSPQDAFNELGAVPAQELDRALGSAMRNLGALSESLERILGLGSSDPFEIVKVLQEESVTRWFELGDAVCGGQANVEPALKQGLLRVAFDRVADLCPGVAPTSPDRCVVRHASVPQEAGAEALGRLANDLVVRASETGDRGLAALATSAQIAWMEDVGRIRSLGVHDPIVARVDAFDQALSLLMVAGVPAERGLPRSVQSAVEALRDSMVDRGDVAIGSIESRKQLSDVLEETSAPLAERVRELPAVPSADWF